LADEERMSARYSNDIEIAKAQRDFQLKSAAYEQDIQTQKAQSELAYALQV
jgi:flotillin